MAKPEREPEISKPPSGKEEEPEVNGTLFLTGVLLMLIFGFWALMYLTMLDT